MVGYEWALEITSAAFRLSAPNPLDKHYVCVCVCVSCGVCMCHVRPMKVVCRPLRWSGPTSQWCECAGAECAVWAAVCRASLKEELGAECRQQ